MTEIPWQVAVQSAKDNVGLTAEQGKLMVDMGSYMGQSWNRLDGCAHVLIGRYCSIGQGVAFCAGYDHDYRRVTTSPLWIHGLGVNDDGGRMRPRRNHILIGNDVWIGDGARIMGGVLVGNGAVIGAGAVVAKDVPPYAIVAGNPAKVIKYRFSQDIIAKLQRIKFWRWPYEKFQENLPLMYDTAAFVDKFDTGIVRDESNLSTLLQGERAKGKKVCFFHGDFGAEEPRWEQMLEQYALYAPEDFLLVVAGSGKEEELSALREKLDSYKSGKGMLYVKGLSQALYQNADYYLAGVDYETLECLDYVSDYGVKVLSALDEDIFHWCGGSRDYIGERIEHAKEVMKHRDFMLDSAIRSKDLPNIQVDMNEEMASTLAQIRGNGRLFGVLVDKEPFTYNGEPLYRHVLERFLDFAGDGDMLFLVAAPDCHEEGKKALEYLSQQGIKNVQVIYMNGNFSYTLLHELDYYLVGRQEADIMYVDYAEKAGTQVLMGAEAEPFSCIAQESAEAYEAKTSVEDDPYREQKEKMAAYVKQQKAVIKAQLADKNYEGAMSSLYSLGGILYEYNQSYTDDELEADLSEIAKEIGGAAKWQEGTRDTVLFYDGFGLDTRGLAAIYLDALSTLPCKVLYLTPEYAKGRLPILEGILKKCNSEICYYPVSTRLSTYETIRSQIDKHRPANGFLYTTPQDVAGLSAFMHYEGRMKRFQINLTDHAFWLGRNAFDYCLEFRGYGACISALERKIPREKLIRLEYYPYESERLPFAGYPFARSKGDFLIFSGGSLYKTMDEERTYYKAVDYIMSKHPQVKFWYAGSGDASELMKLKEKYPDRLFYTAERKDLMEVLRHVDMYMGTYPLNGGLMVQYAAMAGLAPLSLGNGEESSGMLINQDEKGIVFATLDEWEMAMDRYIEDESYRNSLNESMEGAVISKDAFVDKVKSVFETPEPSRFKIVPINDREFVEGYIPRFFQRFKFD